MPRKKKVIIESEIPDEGTTLHTEDGESVLLDGDLTIDNTFDFFGDGEGFLVKVYRITPTGSSFVFATTEKPTATFESVIQDRCPAGGKFVVRRYKNNHIIEPSIHVEVEAKVSLITANNPVENVVAMQARMYQEQSLLFQQMIMAFIGRPAPVQQATPMSELVTMLGALNGITPERKDPIDMLLKGMELAKGINGTAPDWKSELISSAKEVLSPVAQTLSSAYAGGNPPNRMLQQNNERSNDAVVRPPNFIIKKGIDWLKPKILSGMFEPGLAVDLILASSSDPMYAQFITLAVQGDINTFIQIDPELANEPYKTWVETAIKMLREAYDNINKANNDRGTGDSPDSSGDEEISSGKPTLTKVS